MIGPASSLSGMTQHPGSPLLPADAPSPERERGEPTTGALGAGRLIGVDLARGLAVFGMYAVHVGPAPSQDGAIGFLMELAQGRSSALTGTPVVPILAFYGLFFLLVPPLHRLGAEPPAMIAAGRALVGPQLLYVLKYVLKPVVGGCVVSSPRTVQRGRSPLPRGPSTRCRSVGGSTPRGSVRRTSAGR